MKPKIASLINGPRNVGRIGEHQHRLVEQNDFPNLVDQIDLLHLKHRVDRGVDREVVDQIENGDLFEFLEKLVETLAVEGHRV